MTGDYTFLLAVGAGVISFLSPCVLPLVPAYLGQLTAVAVAARPDATGRPSRWVALRHAVAYVAGFGTIFTLLGITAAFAGGALADYIPLLRVVGGVILVVMGLSLAGLLPIAFFERTWRPLDAGASAERDDDDRRHDARPGRRRDGRHGSAAGSSAARPASARRSRWARSSPSAGRRASA